MCIRDRSLVAAFGMTHKTFEGIGYVMERTRFLKEVLPKIRTMGLTLKETLGFNPAGAMVMAFGNFVVFMNYHHAIMPYFTRPWNHLNFTRLGWSLSQELKGDKPQENADFLRTYKAVKRKTKWLETNMPNIKNAMTYNYFETCVNSCLLYTSPSPRDRG